MTAPDVEIALFHFSFLGKIHGFSRDSFVSLKYLRLGLC